MDRIKLTIFFIGLSCASTVSLALPPVSDAYEETNSQNTNTVSNAVRSKSRPEVTSQVSTSADQRLTTIERQITNINQQLTQVEDSIQQIKDLRGKLEEQKHDLQVLQDQVRMQYQNIDQRLNSNSISTTTVQAKMKRNSKTANAIAATEENVVDKKSTSEIASASDQESYQAAFTLLKSKKYSQATKSFQSFVKKFPDSNNIINARYWLGQLYLLQGQLDRSIDQFQIILKKDPESDKSADTMLQLGLAYYAKGDESQAITILKKVVKLYPESNAAISAKNRLKQIQPTDTANNDQTD